MKQEIIEAYATRKGFTRKFNPPESPHMGGGWERLIGTVKRSLKVILQDQLVTEFTLMTIFAEVECLVNSRPFTYVSDDLDDLG